MTKAHRFVCGVLVLLIVGCSHSGQPSLEPSNRPAPIPVEVTDPPVPSGTVSALDDGERPAPELGFTPTALVVLSAPGPRGYDEVFAYDWQTDTLTQITDRVEHDLTIGKVVVSPDGRQFAYTRRRPEESDPSGVCMRSVHGGQALCYWGATGVRLAWRPNSNQVLNWDLSNKLTQILGPSGSGLQPSPMPFKIDTTAQYSPDGKWLTYDNHGLWLLNVDLSGSAVKIDDREAFEVGWLSPEYLAILAFEGNRLGTLSVTDLDGKTTDVGHAVVRPGTSGLSIGEIHADPKGRYVAVGYGIPGATFKYLGVAVYDVQDKTWEPIPSRGVPEILGWLGDRQHLLLLDENGPFILDVVSRNRQQLNLPVSGDYLGVSPDGEWVAFQQADTLHFCQLATGVTHDLKTDRQLVDIVWVPTTK